MRNREDVLDGELMDDRVCEDVVAAYAKRKCADGLAGFFLLSRTQQGPREGDGTFSVVSESLVAKRTCVRRELPHYVELRQQHDDHFSAFLLLFGFKHGRPSSRFNRRSRGCLRN